MGLMLAAFLFGSKVMDVRQFSSRYAPFAGPPPIRRKRHHRLLFLAQVFPPDQAPGCVRTWNITKYLARLGWDITVVTPEPSLWRNADNSDGIATVLERERVRRIVTDHGWRCLEPNRLKHWDRGIGGIFGGICRVFARHFDVDKGIGWVKPAYDACSTLSSDEVDLILATASPFASFKLARRLSDKLRRPYVLDYRDPWTANPHRARPPRLRTIEAERRLLEGAAAVSIVSPSWGSAIADTFGVGAKLHVVTNGYDPEELSAVQPHEFGHFAIVYTGTFYPPKRVITPVMAALRRLKQRVNGKGHEWYFHYYGAHENHVRDEAKSFEVLERVVIHGRVPRREALSAVRGAGIAVVITSAIQEAAREDQGIVTGKIFEALGLGTPILLVAPPDSDAAHILQHAGQGSAFTGSDIEGITGFLSDLIQGRALESREPAPYSWRNVVTRLDAILREAIATRSVKPEENVYEHAHG